MMRYVLVVLLMLQIFSGAAFSKVPTVTLEIAQKAEQAGLKKLPDLEIVRVGIGNQSFGTYVYKNIGVYGTAPLEIYAKDRGLIDKIAANKNVNVFINPDLTYSLKEDDGTEIATLNEGISFKCPLGRLGVKSLKRSGAPALYRGEFQVVKSSSGVQFNLVNVLPVEDYLKGVVPNEMPVSFGLEALKAQSVAARNYVLSPRAKACPNYDVVDSVASQVYFGANTEKELSNQAVIQTEGVVALYNWDLILALYSSTAGGYTESYSNAFSDPITKSFPAPDKPYLRAKPDILYQTPLNDEDAAVAYYKSKPDAYDIRSSYFRWTREWNAEELQSELVQTLETQSATGFVKPVFNKGERLDDLVELKVIKRGESGKVIELEIITQSKTYKIFKELVIRRLLTKDGKALPSANVIFENAQDNEGKLVAVKAYGGGYGHGVGLSQYGAGFMGSELHLPFYKILQHYYSGVTLATKPIIISTEASQVSAVQHFYAPKKSARVVLDNKYGVNELLITINGIEHKYQLPKEVFGYKRYCEIDISDFIRVGKNEVIFTSPEFAGSSVNKGLRLYVELVGRDDGGSIW